ncbi:hypothetical protein [Miltoncostaea oceani]|jgi:hypothetical protein|uniref:hypothetical protein n=1 Tax=Miltoncostaea oceani TaxID=2843216 RepID=UPI001C3CD0C7|nr:hypothetical protein [Miltoncostaea oceani]
MHFRFGDQEAEIMGETRGPDGRGDPRARALILFGALLVVVIVGIIVGAAVLGA